MTTSNDTSSNKITKRDLKSVFFRSLTMEYSWNYERQQHMGYCFSMLPIIRRVYKNKDDQAAAAKRHMEFFNTTPYVSTLILGISAAMEEANANEEDFDESSINSVKAALMSPLAGIGDSLFWGTLRVIATGLGVSLAMQGNILGPLLFLVVFNVPHYLIRYFCLKWGYGFGTSFLSKIEKSGLMPKLTMGGCNSRSYGYRRYGAQPCIGQRGWFSRYRRQCADYPKHHRRYHAEPAAAACDTWSLRTRPAQGQDCLDSRYSHGGWYRRLLLRSVCNLNS